MEVSYSEAARETLYLHDIMGAFREFFIITPARVANRCVAFAWHEIF